MARTRSGMLLSSLRTLLGGDRPRHPGRNLRRHRQLRFEACERRNLLSATISGVKFLDKTANGFSADDAPLAGVTIDLFRDGGDQAFNFDASPGTTDDTLVGSTTSATSTGVYSFAGLTDGLYYVRERVPSGYSRTAGPAFYAFTVSGSQVVKNDGTLLIDDFADPNPATFEIIKGAKPNPNPFFYQNTVSAGTILGGQRDVEINVLENLSFNSATVVTGTSGGQGTLGIGVNPLSAVQAILQYDGTDSSIANAQLLGQVDLTNGGADNAFRLGIDQWQSTTAAAINVRIDVTSPGGTATVTRSIPTTSVITPFDVYVPFSDFTATAGFSFTKATGVQFTINPADNDGARATDVKLDDLALVGVSNSGFDFGNALTNPARLSGWVYVDANNNGVFDSGETPISGVAVNLTGTDNLGNPVSLSMTTDATGYYKFANLAPGTYAVHEVQPAGYLDGKDTIGTVAASRGGTTANDVFSGIALQAGDNANANNFGELLPAQISGYVYVDVNNNGVKDAAESPIAGVTVTLTGTDYLGAAVSQSKTTDSTGFYQFTGLAPGTYTVHELQPSAYTDGKDTIGAVAASRGGTTTNDTFSTIALQSADNATDNNFGEMGLVPTALSKRALIYPQTSTVTPIPAATTVKTTSSSTSSLAGFVLTSSKSTTAGAATKPAATTDYLMQIMGRWFF